MTKPKPHWGLLGKGAWHPTAGRVIVTQVSEDVNRFIRVSYPDPNSITGTATRRVTLSSLVIDEETPNHD